MKENTNLASERVSENSSHTLDVATQRTVSTHKVYVIQKEQFGVPPSRRAYLCLLGATVTGGITGCLGRRGPPKNCPAKSLTPVPYPGRPDTLTKESVQSFVKEVERAYMYTDHAERGFVYVSFDPEPDEVKRVEDGWKARIETSLTGRECTDGTMGVGDGFYTAYYFLNESVVYRAEDGDGETVNPREDGKQIPISN